MFIRGEVVDMVVRGGESVVLTQERCFRLSAVATQVMRVLDDPRTLEEIEADLLATFGPAPDGALASVLDDLISQGLVLRDTADHSEDIP